MTFPILDFMLTNILFQLLMVTNSVVTCYKFVVLYLHEHYSHFICNAIEPKKYNISKTVTSKISFLIVAPLSHSC